MSYLLMLQCKNKIQNNFQFNNSVVIYVHNLTTPKIQFVSIRDSLN